MFPPNRGGLLKRWEKEVQKRVSRNCEEIVDLTKYLSDLRWGVRETVDLTKYLSELRWGVRREIVDLTKYLSGRGWRVKKLRGSNEGSRCKSPIVRRVRRKWNMDQFCYMIDKDQDNNIKVFVVQFILNSK